MNYDDMPAGPEMDALVAEKVMGWTKKKVASYGGGYYAWIDSENRAHPPNNTSGGWHPSINIADAWEVLGALEGEALDNFHDIMGVTCAMHALWCMTSPEAALLICRAALAAVK